MRRASLFVPETFDPKSCAEGMNFVMIGTIVTSIGAICCPLAPPVGYVLLAIGLHRVGSNHRNAMFLRNAGIGLGLFMLLVYAYPIVAILTGGPSMMAGVSSVPFIVSYIVLLVLMTVGQTWFFWMIASLAEDISVFVQAPDIAAKMRFRRNLYLVAMILGNLSLALNFMAIPFITIPLTFLAVIAGILLAVGFYQVQSACQLFSRQVENAHIAPPTDKPETRPTTISESDESTSGSFLPSEQPDQPDEDS